MYDANRMFQELEDAAEARAQAEYEAHLLERNGEILLAKLMVKAKQDGTAIGLCKEVARTQPEWGVHIEGEAAAMQKRSRARAHYANLQALSAARQTEEVSRRQLTK
jgi:hypothetical protein